MVEKKRFLEEQIDARKKFLEEKERLTINIKNLEKILWKKNNFFLIFLFVQNKYC